MAGYLTTHVLDTAQGCPAANMEIELWRLGAQESSRQLVKVVRTNTDGRTNAPLLSEGELTAGIYELVFAVGAYFATQTVKNTIPPFLDRVPVRFGVADPAAHYHVSQPNQTHPTHTYRGS